MSIPVLNGGSWMSSPQEILNQTFAWAVCSNDHQSNNYYDNITSIPYILNKYCNDPDEAVYELKNSLEKYFKRYFDAAEVTASYEAHTKEGTFTIVLSISVTKEGQSYTIGYKNSVEDGVLKDLINAINA